MRKRKNPFAAALALAASLVLTGAVGCGGDDDDHDHDDNGHGGQVGPPTGTECPDGGTELTYESFGRPFVQQYCLRCHSASVQEGDRNGAPDDHNFDTQAECETFADHMDQKAGSGPDSTNQAMPPNAPRPSMEEREQLAEWLACGAP